MAVDSHALGLYNTKHLPILWCWGSFSKLRGENILLRRNIKPSPKQIRTNLKTNLIARIVFCSFVAAVFALCGHKVLANDNTVVSLHVDGETRTITTEATSVGELLKRAEVNLDPADLVEPAPETHFNNAVFNINVYRAKPYIIQDGVKTVTVNSAYQSPKLIIEKSAHIKTYDEDEYKVELIRDFIRAESIGYKLIIDRAVPVQIEVDGTNLKMRTQQDSVGAVLDEKGIVLGANDKLNLGRDNKLRPNMKIVVTRVGHEVMAKEEIIPYPTVVTYDEAKPAGYEEVLQEGKNGQKLVTYEVKKHNGVVVDRTVLQTVNVAEPRAKKVVRGTTASEGTWAALRNCESGGNYANKNNPTYRGAYQFDQSTWDANAPAGYTGVDPADAPPHIQDQAAQTLYNKRGWYPWPSCASKLGLI